MKEDLTITELAHTLDKYRHQNEDFAGSTDQFSIFSREMAEDVDVITWDERKPADDVLPLSITKHTATISPIAHRQISARLGIPYKYYRRMNEDAPELWRNNVRHWMIDEPEVRLFRTRKTDTGRILRAFLSDSYRCLDNWDVAEQLLPALAQECDIVSCSITDSRFYVKAVSRRLSEEVQVGDLVQGGVVITNSEVGVGSFTLSPFIYRLSCTNGMVVPVGGMKKTHLGAKIVSDSSEINNLYGHNRMTMPNDSTLGNLQTWQVLSDDTRNKKDEALWAEARDVIRSLLRPEMFREIVNIFQRSTDRKITKPLEAVEALVKGGKGGLSKGIVSQEEQPSVLRHLIEGGDLSQWGLANAVTATAETVESYDRATELEKAGYRVVSLSDTQWASLN